VGGIPKKDRWWVISPENNPIFFNFELMRRRPDKEKERWIRLMCDWLGIEPPGPGSESFTQALERVIDIDSSIEEVIQSHVAEVYKLHVWNKTATADSLGVNVKTLYNWCQKWKWMPSAADVEDERAEFQAAVRSLPGYANRRTARGSGGKGLPERPEGPDVGKKSVPGTSGGDPDSDRGGEIRER